MTQVVFDDFLLLPIFSSELFNSTPDIIDCSNALANAQKYPAMGYIAHQSSSRLSALCHRLDNLDLRRSLLLVKLGERPVAVLFIRRRGVNDLRMVLVKTHANSWSLVEHDIDLLEGTSGGLDTEEVGQGHEGRTDDGPDPKVVPSDGAEADRSDHDDHEVGHPVREDADGGGLVANAEGLDLGGVGPRDWQDAESEAVEVDEHKCNCYSGCDVGLDDQTASDDGHADRASDRGPDDGPASADLVDVEVWWPREDGVLSERGRGEDEGHGAAEVEVRLENVRQVVAESVDTCRRARSAIVLDRNGWLLPFGVLTTPLVHHVWTHPE